MEIKSPPMPAQAGIQLWEVRAWMIGFGWKIGGVTKCRAGFIPLLVVPKSAG